jgi:hypothetical protein
MLEDHPLSAPRQLPFTSEDRLHVQHKSHLLRGQFCSNDVLTRTITVSTDCRTHSLLNWFMNVNKITFFIASVSFCICRSDKHHRRAQHIYFLLGWGIRFQIYWAHSEDCNHSWFFSFLQITCSTCYFSKPWSFMFILQLTNGTFPTVLPTRRPNSRISTGRHFGLKMEAVKISETPTIQRTVYTIWKPTNSIRITFRLLSACNSSLSSTSSRCC